MDEPALQQFHAEYLVLTRCREVDVLVSSEPEPEKVWTWLWMSWRFLGLHPFFEVRLPELYELLSGDINQLSPFSSREEYL